MQIRSATDEFQIVFSSDWKIKIFLNVLIIADYCTVTTPRQLQLSMVNVLKHT